MPIHARVFLFALTLAISFLPGCKDASISSSASAPVDRAKAIDPRERLPETGVETALQNHGFPTLLKWAEEGDSKAQHFVAVAYLSGKVVPKNFALAETWARRAANQGSPPSQFLMGIIRKDAAVGDNLLALEPNSIISYFWFSLAAARGHDAARVERDKLERAMDSEWVKRAQELALAWRPCTAQACLDQEPSPGPRASCKDHPNSALCP